MQKLSIVIPVFNEAATVYSLLERVLSASIQTGISKEIILVNDYSSDNSDQLILDFIDQHPNQNIIYCKHNTNLGKGAAIHTGISIASGDWLVVQDADLEYDPNEYQKMLQPLLDGHADVVYGSRFMGGKPHRVLFFWHSIGNKFLTFLVNVFSNLNLTDMETCYKMFKLEVIQSLHLSEKRFGFEPEVTLKVARIPKIRIYEVGISYYGRTYEEGKKIGWKDGFQAIYCILKYGMLRAK